MSRCAASAVDYFYSYGGLVKYPSHPVNLEDDMNQMIFNWYAINAHLLQKIYGQVTNCRNFSWILIWDYILPPVFNQTHSSLLITTPIENLTNFDGFGYYLNQRLHRIDNKPTNRLFDHQAYNNFSQKGYSRLSYHLKSFRPSNDVVSGDNLVSICKAIYYFLGDERGVV